MPYATGRALAAAITDRIAQVVDEGSAYTHAQLRRQLAFDRLLARVFGHEPDRWVLKGGGGLLARMPDQARHSIDIDLYYRGQTDAADAVIAAAGRDAGDHFTFDIEPAGDLTGRTTGVRLKAFARLGGKPFDRFGVDVVVESTMTGPPETTPPLQPVAVPGLQSPPYRVYPLADQLADKHLAMVDTYGASPRPSSRYRDLVDIALLATTQWVAAAALHTATLTRYERRGISPAPVALPAPAWATEFPKIAATVTLLRQHTAADAIDIARALFEPVILDGRDDGHWDPESRSWLD